MKNKLVSVVIVSRDRKKDLIECINSYLKSSYKSLEIIIVDNNSKSPLMGWLPKKFPTVKLIVSIKNLGAAGGRNLGLLNTKGEYILFSDDDAVSDKDMIYFLIEAFKVKKDAGIIQPLVYDKKDKNILQGAGHDINLITGRIKAWGVREKDIGQYAGLREVPMCGCVWMVKREVFGKIGNYDEDYFIPYEDSDFSLRARQAGYKLYCYFKAKSYHQGIKTTFINPLLEWIGITSIERGYRIGRNKIIFMSKHSKFPKNLLFFCVLLPIYITTHSLIILSTLRFNIFVKYWEGVIAGLNYMINKIFYKFKFLLMSLTDPLIWIIDKSSNSILDLGCGQGKPMTMISLVKKFNYTVGIDLYEPYKKEAINLNLYDKYLLQDVKEINYQSKSFDIVLASHIIEHLTKKDAWSLIKKMEKIAKREVIIATPIGKMYQPMFDKNKLQEHKSYFIPEEFQKRGYKIIKYGLRWMLDEHSDGLIYKSKNTYLRKLIYLMNFLFTPIYYIFPEICDYSFIAYKKYENQK